MIDTPHHLFFEEDEIGGTCGMHGEKRNTHVVLVVESKRRGPLG